MNIYFLKINLFFILIFIFYFDVTAKTFVCENGYSYKIDYDTSNPKYFFKKSNEDWKIIKKIKILEHRYEFILPNSNYLACSDKSLNVCEFSTLIKYNPNTNQANIREVVLNNCYIGTMGCNQYNKGLELNQRRCKVIH